MHNEIILQPFSFDIRPCIRETSSGTRNGLETTSSCANYK